MENSIQIFNNPEFGEMRTTLSEDNEPLQEYVERGIFEIRRSYHMEGDETVSAITPLITTKGQQYSINGFLSERFSPSPAGGK